MVRTKSISEREKTAKLIVKTSASIRKKHRALKTDIMENEIVLEKQLKRIIKPLKQIAGNTERGGKPFETKYSALGSMLTRWKTKGHIKDSEYRTLYCSDGSLPRAYGLPKIHKPGCPLRIIVSSVGSPLYSLATFLHNRLFKIIPKADSYIKNSFELVPPNSSLSFYNYKSNHDINLLAVNDANCCFSIVAEGRHSDAGFANSNLAHLLDTSSLQLPPVRHLDNTGIEFPSMSCDKENRKQLEIFLFQLLHRPLEFSVCGLFSLDQTLVTSLSKSFLPNSNMFHCKLAFSITNTLKNCIKRGKDKLELHSNENVVPYVYKISCDDCDASYVGQTKRKLGTRLREHISDINIKTDSSSVISNHRVNFNQNFRWNDVKILDSESSYNKRLI
ncbi:hypothetical protein ALC56_09834 [Trachymyrmex septentrionalis]|uniref:Gustatory receptor n=1 Tax=Trachymyrmex septentrionalis TaxID=34720 RepID=A0A151JUI6_9HYME|nr:hypothetical protein ALC56_09834 [Trachymyrmex septentrionalis]